MAHRGTRTTTAQMVGRQSFSDAGDVGIPCAGRRSERARSVADFIGIAGIAGIARNAPEPRKSAFHRKHGIVDLLAIGERAVGQRMLGDDLGNRVLDTQIVFLRAVDG